MCALVYFFQNAHSPIVDKALNISEDQVLYQTEINKLIISEPTDKAFALSQLKKMLVLEKIMNKYNWYISEEILKKEQERIDKNTRSASLLEKIKKIEGFPEDFYLHLFVKKTLIERTIFNDFYYHTPILHENTYYQALTLKEKLKTENIKTIKELTWNMHGEFFEFSISPKEGFSFKHMTQKEFSNSNLKDNSTLKESTQEATSDWFLKHAELNSNPIQIFDYGEDFALIKADTFSKEKNIAKGIQIKLAKKPYNEWITEELKNWSFQLDH